MSFFRDSYGVPSTLLSDDGTSRDDIDNWLRNDLTQDTSPAVHLLFILTHGDALPDGRGRRRLYLATTSTEIGVDQHFANLDQTIPAREVIAAIKSMPTRSLVFLFMDVCGSGDMADEVREAIRTTPDLADRLHVVAGAYPGQQAFSARLTKSLLHLWTNASAGQCTKGEGEIEAKLTEGIRDLSGQSARMDQDVLVIWPGKGPCIEAFGRERRQAFLFNGSIDTVHIEVAQDTPSPSDPELRLGPIAPKRMMVLPLESQLYSVMATRMVNPPLRCKIELDLRKLPVAVRVLFSDDPADKLAAELIAASELEAQKQHLEHAAGSRAAVRRALPSLQKAVDDEFRRAAEGAPPVDAASLKQKEEELAAAERACAAANERLRMMEEATAYVSAIPRPELLMATGDAKEAAERVGRAKNDAELLRAQDQRHEEATRASRLRRETLAALDVELQARERKTSAERELQTYLARHYAIVSADARGVVVDLQRTSLPSDIELLFLGSIFGKYNRLVRVAKERRLRMELEFLATGDASADAQAKLRRRMGKLVRRLQMMGLRTPIGGRIEYQGHAGDAAPLGVPKLTAVLSPADTGK